MTVYVATLFKFGLMIHGYHPVRSSASVFQAGWGGEWGQSSLRWRSGWSHYWKIDDTNYFVTDRYSNFLFFSNIFMKVPLILYLFACHFYYIAYSPFRLDEHSFYDSNFGAARHNVCSTVCVHLIFHSRFVFWRSEVSSLIILYLCFGTRRNGLLD
jgi:hypothetical protein